jgi:hypothetical protein
MPQKQVNCAASAVAREHSKRTKQRSVASPKKQVNCAASAVARERSKRTKQRSVASPQKNDRSVVTRARRIANLRGYRALMQWIREPLALRGEWVEMKYCARATANGLTATKPWGHVHSYDVITEFCGRFARVQIKGTASFNGKSFVVPLARARAHPLTPRTHSNSLPTTSSR